MHVQSLVVSDSLKPHGLQPTRLFCPGDFFKHKFWSGLPFPTPGDLPDPGIESVSLVSPALAGGFLALRHLGISKNTTNAELEFI